VVSGLWSQDLQRPTLDDLAVPCGSKSASQQVSKSASQQVFHCRIVS
jgi:hypothetical protein